jgi:hypothetical protein
MREFAIGDTDARHDGPERVAGQPWLGGGLGQCHDRAG